MSKVKTPLSDYEPLEGSRTKQATLWSKYRIWIILAILLILLVIVIVLAVTIKGSDEPKIIESVNYMPLYGTFEQAGIAADGSPCASVGRSVLADGGSAVDSAIAALLCNGVYNSQSMGIGGGFLMTILSKGNVYSLDARETAPAGFNLQLYGNDSSLALKGPLSVAVPGEIAGYWEAKRRFGNPDISWRRLLQPTIDMCRNGIQVSWTMAEAISKHEFIDEGLQRMFTNPSTGQLLNEGDIYFRTDLASTLEKLAEAGDKGDELFYRGEIGQMFINDLKNLGGIITMEDMANYKPLWKEPISMPFSSLNLTLYSAPPPGSGAVLAGILNIMEKTAHFQEDDLFYHRLVEAFKFAYGERSKLGDPQDDDIREEVAQLVNKLTSDQWGLDRANLIDDFSTNSNISFYGGDFVGVQDGGTAHISVISEDGDAVSVTSTINQKFGSDLMSSSTGIIYNDEMDDFSFPGFTNDFGLPPSPANFPKPGKRPLSSMSPSIFVTDDGKVKMVVGGAGGSKITTATALTSLHALWANRDIGDALQAPRLHHQLCCPNAVEYQSEFDQNIIKSLEERGHQVDDIGDAGSVVTALYVEDDGNLKASADYRKAGGVDGY